MRINPLLFSHLFASKRSGWWRITFSRIPCTLIVLVAIWTFCIHMVPISVVIIDTESPYLPGMTHRTIEITRFFVNTVLIIGKNVSQICVPAAKISIISLMSK